MIDLNILSPRIAEQTVQKLASFYPIVAVLGPRQTGKTTLVKKTFPSHSYVSLEDPDKRAFATEDPRKFLEHYKDGGIFDEIQNVPEIFSYLQGVVDNNSKMGRFILTGSQQFSLFKEITQSLAGRVGLLTLLPFSYDEMTKYQEKSPLNNSLDYWIFSGSYPPVHHRQIEPTIWYGDYIETYCQRDVRQLLKIKDLNAFYKFLSLCAGRTGQLLNVASLASDASISSVTAEGWLSVLEASFILYRLPPYFENFSKRLTKQSKLYFYDTGLASRLLGIRTQEELLFHPLRGALFETWVMGEIKKNILHKKLSMDMYFWRDHKGLEIDLLIPLGKTFKLIEIKSSSTINTDMFKQLTSLKQLIESKHPDSVSLSSVIYGGDETMDKAIGRFISWDKISELLK